MKVFMSMIANDGYHDDRVHTRGGTDGHNEDGDRERGDEGPCPGVTPLTRYFLCSSDAGGGGGGGGGGIWNRMTASVLWLDKGDFPENVHTVCPC